MTAPKQTIRDAVVRGKRVLVRSDFNVTIDPNTGQIVDDARLRLGLKTYQYLIAEGAIVVGMTHLGRPDGKFVPELSTQPIARHLAALLKHPVQYLPDCVGQPIEQQVKAAKPGQVFFLENTRFHHADEENNPSFAKDLARLGEVFINDGFGVSHRAQASVVGVAQYLPVFAGFSLEQEWKRLDHFLSHIQHPYVVVLGGAKLADKVGLIQALLPVADHILLGSALAVALWKAEGREVGSQSLYDPKTYEDAKKILLSLDRYPEVLLTPHDVVVGKEANARDGSVAAFNVIPKEMGVFDIGPATLRRYCDIIVGAKSILLNGPQGYFENPHFALGTEAVFTAVAKNGQGALVGGGETLAALDQFGLRQRIGAVSEGGGAMLEYVEGRVLPGISIIPDKKND